jgi:acyl CoA:acetate/3-ketoacid CoA transferase
MVRAMAAHVPAHFTTVGIGTSVDPMGSGSIEEPPPEMFIMKGGKMNQLTMSRGDNIVTDVFLHGQRYLVYKV